MFNLYLLLAGYGSFPSKLGAIVCASFMAIALLLLLIAIHEAGHWFVARALGLPARFEFIPARHSHFREGRVLGGWLHLGSVHIDDDVVANLARWKVRAMAAAGPIAEIAVMATLIGCLDTIRQSTAVPMTFAVYMFVWVWGGVAWLNWVPLKRIKNDGWYVLTGKF